MIYLDNSATTRPFDSVIDAMDRCMRENYFNASAAYKPAVDVDRAMRECRRAIAAQLGIQDSGVIFTGGGTESDNLAILGVAETLRQSANFVCSAIEHPAVAETIHRVEQMGHTVRVLPIDVRGVVDLAACETVIDEHTALVSCMQVSNETGAIQPVEELAKLARRKNPNVRVHVDGVQGFMRVPMHMEHMGVDLYALSGHKIHGPKGIGVLAVRPGVRLIPQITGGGQEKGLRSGTYNSPAILGLGEAVKTLAADRKAVERMRAMKAHLWAVLSQEGESASTGRSPERRTVRRIPQPVLRRRTRRGMRNALEGEGVLVSTGSASASHKQKVSPTLRAMGLSQAQADGTVRVSLGAMNTMDEMDEAARHMLALYRMLRQFKRR
ncbi:MAG: cysteine desulfurase family protein [Christensenellales bacterium]